MSIDMTLPKWAIFTMGSGRENSMSFVGSSWNVFSDYMKNVDAYHVSFNSKKQVIIFLSPTSLWQTNTKWTVVAIYDSYIDQVRSKKYNALKATNSFNVVKYTNN